MFENSLDYFNNKKDKCVGDITSLSNINYAINLFNNYKSNLNNLTIIKQVYELMLPDCPMQWFHHITKNTIIRLNKLCKKN